MDPNLLLTRLSNDALRACPVIVHGTYAAAWQGIQESGGLSRRNRTHIHFAAGLPGSDGIISGMRKSCQVYIYVDAPKCAQANVPFFQSDNGVRVGRQPSISNNHSCIGAIGSEHLDGGELVPQSLVQLKVAVVIK